MKKTNITAAVLAFIVAGTSFTYVKEYSYNNVIAADVSEYEEYTEGDLEYKIYTDHVAVSRCEKEAVGEIIIPEEINGVPVTEIGADCFKECKDIKSVVIPDSIKKIGKYAFWFCRGLTSVNIPKNITVIETGVFYSCTSLRSVTIPNSVTEIGSTAFLGCERFISIVIPDSVKSIDSAAFMGCTQLKNIIIPESVTSIAQKAFANCPKLTMYGHKDSLAEEYANKYNFSFIDLAAAVPPSSGDPNGDGRINAVDASEILSVYARTSTDKTKPKGEELEYGDVDRNDAVNAVDASYVLSYYAYTSANSSETKMSFGEFMKKN